MRVNNRGDYQTRTILRVRVQRDRRPSAIGVCDGRIRCRRRDVWFLSGRSGLGIAPVGGDRAGHTSISSEALRRGHKHKTRKV